MGTDIGYRRPDGAIARGYLAKAGVANASGIIVIQEWWGVQQQIRGVCDRLALAGYDALAPDLYEGVIVPYHDRETADLQMKSLDFLKATDQHVTGAARYLLASSPKVGVTGFCLGGAMSILAACRIPEISAAVAFYGLPAAGAVNASELRVPLQGHFALRDAWYPPHEAKALEAELLSAGKGIEFFFYECDHGFANEQRPHHDRHHAELAWARALRLWRQYL